MARRGSICICAIAAVAVFAAGCGGSGPGGSSPALKLSACTVQEVAARCGTFGVPENPAAPSGRKISLSVVVVPATGSDRAPDPLLYFEGGPGGAATGEVAWAAARFSDFNQRHDLVFVDQRGTGGSNPVACQTPSVSTEAQLEAVMKSCLESIKGKADPVFYSTPIAVDDFDAVRAALGYEKVDVYGVSYGVSSALTYIQRHGGHVRAAVLDSGSLLDFRLWEQVPKSALHALTMLFDRCRSDSACGKAFPRLEADFAAVLDALGKNPLTVDTIDPGTGELYRLDRTQFLGMVIDEYLAKPDGVASFPRDVHAAASGDWTAITQKAAAGITPATASIAVMRLTVTCSDEWAALDPEREATIAPESPFTAWEVAFATSQAALCKYWPRAAGATGRVRSDAPIVFLNAASDPVDPPVNVAGAAADMPNSVVVAIEGTGHWQLNYDPTHCLVTRANTFLDAGAKSTAAAWECPTVQPPFLT